jgi:hypothetical protein
MRFFTTFLLSILISGCSAVAVEDRLKSGGIFVGMSKQQLNKAYFWRGHQSDHPFAGVTHLAYFPNKRIEIIIPRDQTIIFVFENVTTPSGEWINKPFNSFNVHHGTGTLRSFHSSILEAEVELAGIIGDFAPNLRAKIAGRERQIQKQSALAAAGIAEARKESLEKWTKATTAIIGLSVAYAESESNKPPTQKDYDFLGTESMNSSELGSELLNQKKAKGIRGKGKVVTALPTYKVSDDPGKPIPGTATPSIGYNPQDSAKQNKRGQAIGYDSAFTVVPMLDAGLTCIYMNGDKAVAFMKSNGCPSSVKWPNEYSNEIFDMTQGGKVATDGLSRRLSISNSNSTSCAYYIQPGTHILVPKGRGASCPSRMVL